MILGLLGAVAVAATSTPAPPNVQASLAAAHHAVQANRLDQAGLMISRAIANGASGPRLDRVLAELIYARGNYREALVRYVTLLKAAPDDQSLLEPAAIASLKLGEIDQANALLRRATSKNGASWRVWNACGVAADFQRDWNRADECYDQAVRLAEDGLEPTNNRGWSLLLRGDWTGARALFERAVMLDPKSERAANNLELAKAALAADLPARETGQSDRQWAARLNDAGVAAVLLGDKSRAAAAFTQALDVSGSWYSRAANNLEAIRGQ
jgi:Flp pilus assembly protein TadD